MHRHHQTTHTTLSKLARSLALLPNGISHPNLILTSSIAPAPSDAHSSFEWQQGFVPQWVETHNRDAVTIGKPSYLGEFSVADADVGQRDVIYTSVLETFANTVHTAGVNFWQLTLSTVNCCDRALVLGREGDVSLLSLLESAAIRASERNELYVPPSPSPLPLSPPPAPPPAPIVPPPKVPPHAPSTPPPAPAEPPLPPSGGFRSLPAPAVSSLSTRLGLQARFSSLISSLLTPSAPVEAPADVASQPLPPVGLNVGVAATIASVLFCALALAFGWCACASHVDVRDRTGRSYCGVRAHALPAAFSPDEDDDIPPEKVWHAVRRKCESAVR